MAFQIDLTGKAAIVTGASRGIGAATARKLAASGAGVVLAARSEDAIKAIADEITKAGGKATAVACDVSRYDDISMAVEACRSTFGRLDILVNNAGAIEPVAQLAESDPDAWVKVADINYKGVYFGMRAAIPAMLERGGGTIINVSSGAATSPLEGWSHYCSAKAAALMLTRCADKEHRAHGIRVLGLSPGTVATDMQVAIKKSGINPVSQLDFSVHIPPEWPAEAIAFLCSPEADDYRGTDLSLRDEGIRQRLGLV